MKHLILTRFNVLMPGWDSQIHLKHSWLDGRFSLFEDMCLPSVAAQTNKNFEWLIFFDVNTPEPYKKKIEELRQVFPFHALYVEIFNLEKISKDIYKQFSGEATLLTSRLDSDDILAIDYVNKLHEVASSLSGRHVINFDHGAILFSKNNKRYLYEYEDESNPFTSLMEPFALTLSTILAANHTTLHDFANVVHVKDKPMWLQVVHGGNVSNRVRGKRVKMDKYNSEFLYMRLVSHGVKESKIQLGFDNLILGTYRDLRDFMRSILKSIYMTFKKLK